MEEKILSILLEIQTDLRKIQVNQVEMKQE